MTPWKKIARKIERKRRKGFSLFEVMMVVGIIGIATTMSIPMLHQYQIRSDLETASSTITQAVGRARTRAQSGEKDSDWGFYVPKETVYKGDSYDTRDPSFDESYPIPPSITVAGITDVSFAKITGLPSTTGEIILTGFDGEQRTIDLSLTVAGLANQQDLIEFCHNPRGASPQTEYTSDSLLPGYLAQGDIMGACPAASSSSRSSVASSSSVSSVSSVSSSVSSAISSSVASSSSSAAGGASSSSTSSIASSSSAGGTGGGASSVASSSSSVSSASSSALALAPKGGVVLLDTSSAGALSVSGNGQVEVDTGSIIVNSSNATAVSIADNGILTCSTLGVVGRSGLSKVSTGQLTCTLNSGASAVADPYASLAIPPKGNVTLTNWSISGNGKSTLSPNTYKGGITISGNAKVTMNPGVYYLQGGGLNVSGNATLTGNNVLLYTDNGTISLSGNGVITLTPPKTGTYAGILFYQDRSDASAITLIGNGSLSLKGTVYAPAAAINISGNGTSNVVGSLLISKDLAVSGNGKFTVK